MNSQKTLSSDLASRNTALNNGFLNLNEFIDHTLLKPDAAHEQFEKLFAEATQYQFRTVCVPPVKVAAAKNFFEEHNASVGVCTVIGFPLGYSSTKVKVFETEDAIHMGATEVDFVQNVQWVKNKEWNLWSDECKLIVKAAGSHIVKIILETSLLNDDEIMECSERALEAGVHILKTSTGFGTRGALVRDVEIMNSAFLKHPNLTVGIKASGGVRTRNDAIAMIRAGATRLGTSNGVAIVTASETATSSY